MTKDLFSSFAEPEEEKIPQEFVGEQKAIAESWGEPVGNEIGNVTEEEQEQPTPPTVLHKNEWGNEEKPLIAYVVLKNDFGKLSTMLQEKYVQQQCEKEILFTGSYSNCQLFINQKNQTK